MNDDELKRVWCKQKLDPAKLSSGDQVKLMRLRMKALYRATLWVQAMEIVVTAGCILFWAWLFFLHSNVFSIVSRIGFFIMITSLTFDIWKPIRARRMTPQPPADAALTQWLRHELKKVRASSELSRARLLWNLLPYFIGVMFFTWGLDVSLSSRILLSVFLTPIWVILYVGSWKLSQSTHRRCDWPLY